MTKTYTMVRSEVNTLMERKANYVRLADHFRPFSKPWQDLTEMANGFDRRIEKIFEECNPSYRTMFKLEMSRKARA